MFGTSEPALRPLTQENIETARSLMASVSVDRLRRDVTDLIGPHNRFDSSGAMAEAENSIASSLRDAGWETKRVSFACNHLEPAASGVNITALRPGTESGEILLIEAHYDTVNMSPGADDNMASVAALLELARLLKPYQLKKSVMLACCDMEELGFIGADHLVKELRSGSRVRGAIVFETMAYTSKEQNSQAVPPGFEKVYPGQFKRLKERGFVGDTAVVIYHNNGKKMAVRLGEGLAHIAGGDSVMLVRGPADIPVFGQILGVAAFPLVRHFYRADHYPFLRAGIPAIQITDSANFRNPHYHATTDTPDTLNYRHLANIVVATALTILGSEEKI